MDKQRSFRRALLAVVLGAFGVSGTVTAVNEEESNHPIGAAQKLGLIVGTVTVDDGAVGNLTGSETRDVDFYSFEGEALDVVTIEVRGREGTPDVDTFVYVFGPVNIDPAKSYLKLRENDDCTLDTFYSCINNFTLPAKGTYTVGVTSFPHTLRDGGILMGDTAVNDNGGYTLVISRVTLSVQPINIDIKPGSRALAQVNPNPKSRGKIPVALLSSDKFNALDVNVASLTFGATGDEQSLPRCGKNGEDVNGDGRLDLVCHFENQLAKFTPGDLEGIVKGATADGRQFEGRGLLKVVPVKRKH